MPYTGASQPTKFVGLAPGLVGVYQLNFVVLQPIAELPSCSVVDPNLRFVLVAGLPPMQTTDYAMVCVVTTNGAQEKPGSKVVLDSAISVRIPAVLREAFAPKHVSVP